MNGSILHARIRQLFVGQGSDGIRGGAGGFGHVHFLIQDLYLAGNNAVGLRATGGQSDYVGYIDHILKTGSPTGTTGIYVDGANATIRATITEVVADTVYNIVQGSLYLICTRLSGTRTGTPNMLVSDVDVVLPNPKKANFAASTAPGSGDDEVDGYAPGSLWIDTTNDNVYQCVDASTGAAVWKQLDAGASAAWQLIDYHEFSANAASYTLSSGLGGFKAYRIMGRVRTDANAARDFLKLQINGDTGNNYLAQVNFQNQAGTAGQLFSNSATDGIRIYSAASGASTVASAFATFDLLIESPDKTSKYRPLTGCGVGQESSSVWVTLNQGGFWKNTAAAISSLAWSPVAGGNILQDSVIQVWGMT